MPRTITGAVAAQITATSAEYVHLIELDFSSGAIYLSTGTTDLAYNGHTYTAIGGVLSFNTIPESGDISQAQVEIVASGVNTTVIAALLTNFFVNYGVVVTRAYFTPGSQALETSPVVLFSGLMNGGVEIREKRPMGATSLPTCEVTIRCSSRIANLEEHRGIQCNLVSDQQYYPGDRIMELAQQISFKPLTWTGTQITQQ